MDVWYILITCVVLCVPYFLPLIPARKLEQEPKIIISYWLYYRAFAEGVFLIPSFVLEYLSNDSPALQLNLIYVIYTNMIIAALIYMIINLGLKKKSSPDSDYFWKSKNIFGEIHILIAAVSVFLLYVVMTGGLALIDPRLAYQTERAGIGFIWAGYISLASIWVAVRVANRKSPFGTFVVYLVFCYFSGSKGLLFAAFLPFLANPRVSTSFRIKTLITFFPVVLIGFLSLFSQFSANQELLYRLGVYFDMFHQSTRVFEDYLAGQFDFRYGEIYVSSLWQFVPRALYNDKPYSWGSTSLVEYYYPGMADTGATPSFGLYTTDFADFGFLGFFSVIFNLTMGITFYALYVIVRNNSKNRKIYFICFAYLIAPGIYFHTPLMVALPIAYGLLTYRKKTQAILN